MYFPFLPSGSHLVFNITISQLVDRFLGNRAVKVFQWKFHVFSPTCQSLHTPFTIQKNYLSKHMPHYTSTWSVIYLKEFEEFMLKTTASVFSWFLFQCVVCCNGTNDFSSFDMSEMIVRQTCLFSDIWNWLSLTYFTSFHPHTILIFLHCIPINPFTDELYLGEIPLLCHLFSSFSTFTSDRMGNLMIPVIGFILSLARQTSLLAPEITLKALSIGCQKGHSLTNYRKARLSFGTLNLQI